MRRFVPPGLRRLRHRIGRLDRLDELDHLSEIAGLRRDLDDVREALGRIESRQLASTPGPLAKHEFRVHSHSGEDGIIQFLTNEIAVPNKRFVEFGVEDYREANTRFLLTKDHWTGLVIDGSEQNIARLQADAVYWNADLTATAAFVTRENINELLESAGFAGEIGLLSVDVDGNDYWIFDAIAAVQPAIAIVEYNHRFGPTRSVTIPYNPAYVRKQTDWTWLFGGASLAAIVAAGARKNMSFVGCNSFGNNAFFVRTDLLPPNLAALSSEEGFVAGKFREALLRNGAWVVPSVREEAALMEQASLVEVS